MANGDVTYSHKGGMQSYSAHACGKYTGSGAAIHVLCGFQPTRIVIHNDTDDTEYLWFKGMTAGYVFQYTSAGSKTLESGMSGPVVFAGDDDEGEGFTVDADSTEMNTAADDCYWEAWR